MKRDYTTPIEKFEILNLARKVIRTFPSGVSQFPYTLIVSESLWDTLNTFLKNRIDFKEQPTVSHFMEIPYDWSAYTSNTMSREVVFYISVSQRVFTDTEFRGLIIEKMI